VRDPRFQAATRNEKESSIPLKTEATNSGGSLPTIGLVSRLARINSSTDAVFVKPRASGSARVPQPTRFEPRMAPHGINFDARIEGGRPCLEQADEG
jgi:hypothetical protein